MSSFEPPNPSVPGGGYEPPPQPYPAQGQPPPPPQPYPPQAYPPPAPKKSSGTWWKVLLAIFLALALGIAACTVWFVSTVTAPVDTSNDFLAAADRGDYDAALAFSDSRCNLGMTAADLAGLFGGADLDYDLTRSNIVNSSATVGGSLRLDEAPTVPVNLFLEKLDDDWKVCGITFG